MSVTSCREEFKLGENVDLQIESKRLLPPLVKELKHDGACAFRHKRNVTSLAKNDLMCREGLFIFKRLKMT